MIVKYSELKGLRRKWKSKSIVCASGTFDILHFRHIGFLEKIFSFKKGKTVILINHDWRVRQRKGPNRPINKQINRAIVINALKGVDAVVLCPWGPSATERCLEKLKPNFYISIDSKRWKNKERFFKENNIKFIHFQKGRGGATSHFIKKVIEVYNKKRKS